MKAATAGAAILAIALSCVVAGCGPPPGEPGPGPRAETLRPDQTMEFSVLYKDNCSACHGDDGLNGAAFPLHNPVYLAWAGHDRMVQIVAKGASARWMHAFARTDGGFLTGQQVNAIVNGMIEQWGQPGILNGTNPPAYKAAGHGNVAAGKVAFGTYCARCHGADGTGGTGSERGIVHGSIVDPTYLALVSGRGLRDIVVAGMMGAGMPDWRGDAAGKPMTEKDVTDVVAWLASHRTKFPGQPFPNLPSIVPPAGTKFSAKGK